MPQMMLIRVVLPAPFGPSSAKISPWRMLRLTPLSAWNPDAYVFDRFRTETAGGGRVDMGQGTRAGGRFTLSRRLAPPAGVSGPDQASLPDMRSRKLQASSPKRSFQSR